MGMMQAGQCGEQRLKDIACKVVLADSSTSICQMPETCTHSGKTGINEENKVILVTQLQLQSYTWHVAEFWGRQRVYQCYISAETPGQIWYQTEIILTSFAELSKQTYFTNFSLIRF